MSPKLDLLTFNKVEYIYPCSQRPAVQNLTLSIPQHQRCAIIGRNGCGKTTFFRLANGLYRPKKGTIQWLGKPLRYNSLALNQLRCQVGLVFQNPEQQLVATTVAEDISYGLCNLGLSDSEITQRVQQALLDFDLIHLADAPINYLSLGQKKRVSIADVMVLQPKLLLLDEPTAYLDPQQVRNFHKTLETIQNAGTTVVLATHNLDFVEAWADWVIVMDAGQIVLTGTPEIVFSQEQNMLDLGLDVPLAVKFLKKIQDEVNPDKIQQIRQLLRE
ncbi:MAG: ABC transporter ATP-binding protein [Microcoleaceae cyanobacterium]